MSPLIVVVDYGMGNLRSVANALAYLGCRSAITSDPSGLDEADGVIVPGVGAFPDAMRRLEQSGLAAAIHRHVQRRKPLLGICLGMQILFEYGEEGCGAMGLGLIPGRVVRLQGPALAGLKVPHMGWDTVEWVRDDRAFPLLNGLEPPQYFYFVHSYCVPLPLPVPSDPAPGTRVEVCSAVRVAWCSYGIRFVAAVQKGNIMGTQFHPEKSGRAGLAVVRNFVALCGDMEIGQGLSMGEEGDASPGEGGAVRCW